MGELFDVVISGEIEHHLSRKQVEDNLKSMKGLSDSYIARMLSGKSMCVKKGVPEDKAQLFKNKLQKIGLISQVKPSSMRSGSDSPAPHRSPQTATVSQQPTADLRETPQPQVVFIERPATDGVISASRPNVLSYLFSWLSGLLLLGLGLAAMLAFSPFPDGTVRRGMLLGLFLFGLGAYRIIRGKRSF